MFGALSTIFLILLTTSVRLAVSAPPGCLLAAVNTQSNPADVALLCGADSSGVQAQIKKLCGNNLEAALKSYRDTCKAAGNPISSASSSSLSTTSRTLSASSTIAFPVSSTKSSTLDSFTGSNTLSVSGSAFVTSRLFPVSYTSTYFEIKCSCTKTTQISSTVLVRATGFSTVGGNAGVAVSTGTLKGAPGPLATGSSPKAPSGSQVPGSSPTTSSFIGAASGGFGSFAGAVLAFAGLAIAL